jgi:hypothetical protein
MFNLHSRALSVVVVLATATCNPWIATSAAESSNGSGESLNEAAATANDANGDDSPLLSTPLTVGGVGDDPTIRLTQYQQNNQSGMQRTAFQPGPLSEQPNLGSLQWSTAGDETEPDREEYPHIFSTDVWDPNRFFYTNRPNILGRAVPESWDAMKLINTDRPDFTDVATVVGKGVAQLETGWTYDHRQQSDVQFNVQTIPESLLRIGRSDRFEWRIKWTNGYTTATYRDIATNHFATISGVSDTTLGFKYTTFFQDDWMPLQTIVTRLGVPTGSYGFSANTVQPGISYVYNWQVRKWWFTRGSTGVDFLNNASPVFSPIGSPSSVPTYTIGYDYQVQGFQSFSTYLQLAQRVGMFVEWYALFHSHASDDHTDQYQNYGWYFYATPNLQFDARIGARLGTHANEVFTGAGVSFRFQ